MKSHSPDSPNPVWKHSRRSFLIRGCVVGGGTLAGLPQILPARVLGAAGQPGPNDQIGIGFVGMGRQATDLLKMLPAIKEARVVAIADVNLARAEAVASRYNAAAVKDYRRLLEMRDVDAIITATPDHWRALICIHACQAGKDIYAEKPLTLTVREGRLIVEAVRKYKRVLQTGSQQRSSWPNRCGCGLVRNGAIGKIKRVVAHNYPSPWECGLPAQPVPEKLDWDMWCGPVEPIPYNQDLYLPRANPGWISFRPFSGGEMTGWGSHGLDQVQWALGMDEGGPIEVWTEGPRFDPPTYTSPESRERGDKICSQPKVFFRYPGDVVVELADGPAGGAKFIGENGTITIDRGVCKSDPPEIAEDALTRRPAGLVENHMRDWFN
ncbi:MAG: Gfo/Idh/MocA family oxidoreductase, partial [Verrucomicrobiae bacterium]|nr:Gfo/Idh/MocA family oxidoreductase [Verrucomicrobiae bacterium]